jgi:aspartate racemase
LHRKGVFGVKTIGLIGGMSWESSIEYYRIINETVKERLGGLHSAKCIMHSVDFAEVEPLQHEDRWDEAAEHMVRAAESVEAAEADFLVLCTNTMHKTADEIARQTSIPLLHIADATAEKIRNHGLTTVGLLGTRFTMEDDFYKGRLIERHSLSVIVPAEDQRQIVHQVIYDELCRGIIQPTSRQKYVEIMGDLVSQGAEAIILGCTEIGLLVRSDDCQVPDFDTTRIHAEAAVDLALADD